MKTRSSHSKCERNEEIMHMISGIHQITCAHRTQQRITYSQGLIACSGDGQSNCFSMADLYAKR